MVLEEFYALNNGVRIPKLALGTWQIPEVISSDVVFKALDIGYKHIDTAIAYENETGVGIGLKKAIEELKIPRESLFVTSKIPAEIKNYKEAVANILDSFKRINSTHIDLMLIHAPKPWCEMFKENKPNYYKENLEVWKALEEAYEWKKYRAIGVSNFSVDDLKNILDNSPIKPAVNQIRVHIGHVPEELIAFCKANDILVEAYSPNATGKLSENKTVQEIAKKYNVSVPQLGCRFDLQLGLLPLPKSTHEAYIRENAKLDFEISESDMERLLCIQE